MNAFEIKQQMMKLWKDTFHDSDEYIHLVFDNYFNRELIAYKEVNGEIIAALLAVPYDFNVNIPDDKDANDYDSGELIKFDSIITRNLYENISCDLNILKGLYLCGLATKKTYRHNGIMTELIEEINEKAKNLNFDFTFLIPADDALEYYYRLRGYVGAFKRYENNFVAGYQFKKSKNYEKGKMLVIDNFTQLSSIKLSIIEDNHIDYKYIYEADKKENIFTEIDDRIFKSVQEYIHARIRIDEINNRGVTLFHSKDDVKNILEENILFGGNIFISDAGVAVINFTDDKIIIPHIFCNDISARDELLQAVSDKFPLKPIIYYSYAEDKNNHLLEPKNYGMIRFLKVDEILKFVAESSRDLKFSILVKDVDEGEMRLYNAEDGRLTSVALNDHSNVDIYKTMKRGEVLPREKKSEWAEELAKLKNGGEVTELTIRELTEILCRNPEAPDYARMAFSLPRIPFCMSYMLD